MLLQGGEALPVLAHLLRDSLAAVLFSLREIVEEVCFFGDGDLGCG